MKTAKTSHPSLFPLQPLVHRRSQNGPVISMRQAGFKLNNKLLRFKACTDFFYIHQNM